jgi:TatD DNase family protein
VSVELFDTHAHLHFPDFDADRAETLARAREAGVTRLLTIGTEVPTSRAAIALAESEPDVWAAVGVHPHDAAEADEAMLAEIERLAGAPRVAAVGEIGLDFFRNLSPPDAQARVFRHLIGVARRARKPVLVHCRDAHADVLAILAEERASEVGGIMHCFSGDVAIARRCLDLGLITRALPATDTIAFSPPFVITEGELGELAATARRAVDDVWAELRQEGSL